MSAAGGAMSADAMPGDGGAADSALQELRTLDGEARLLEHTAAVLNWDQETYMPEQAVEERAGQQALLQSLIHQRNTSDRVGELLESVRYRYGEDAPEGADTDGTHGRRNQDGGGANAAEEKREEISREEVNRAFVREKDRQYRQSTRIPARLVRELAETASRGQHAWAAARRADDYNQFKPWLEKLLNLSRETADVLGHDGNRYDALLDQYEPYARTDDVTAVFATLRAGLVDLVGRIGEAPQVDTSFLDNSFPADRQESISRRVMAALGYDANRGRLDRSAHPFTTTLGAHDVRITTRYDEKLVTSGLFSTIHETGHALYELGVAESLHGTILAEGTSLGIHESQSRMWENMIGRSREFWTCWLPDLGRTFPDQLQGVSLEAFYRGINRVEPSLIRVEADEVTYGLHVIMRFELEQALLAGDLTVDDLPGAWNEKSRTLLGVEPPDYAHGVLQDVHWSFGAFGYFPTYALGNLYAAQFLTVMEREMPDMWNAVAAGETGAILAWLRSNIHRYGKVRSAGTLVEEITGQPLDPSYFIDYLNRKYGEIYRI
ncbi:MAG: carboxypeptidase M32 [Spirochaeta sp.]|jgi:carboxypeptidase Taq|nr:carboxypeptidase M32 [Spirochaeta sp.]